MKLAQAPYKNINQAHHLSLPAKRVIAMLNMGMSDSEIIGLFTHPMADEKRPTFEKRQADVVRLIAKIKASDHPTIRKCIDEGLPAGICVSLPFEEYDRRVRCPLCKRWLTRIPCLLCGLRDAPPGQQVRATKDRPEPDRATKEYPGSWLKINEFCRRLDAGMALFHPGDRRLETYR